MEKIFDQSLVEAHRARALANADPKAGFLLDIVAEELAERVSVVERHFDRALELHGYTGQTGRHLMATGKIDTIERVETDARFGSTEAPVTIASLEEVPAEPESFNLIVSPLSLHLTNDTPGAFIQVRRALKPDGLFLAAIPGTGTLQELREALLAAEAELTGGASPRVIPFADVRDVGALLQRAGFALPVTDTETYTVRYDSLFALIRDLRAMGMTSPLAARSRVPVSRRFFLRAAEIYAERFSDPDGRVRATFSIIYLSGWAPHESQQKPLKPGSAKQRLSAALGTKEQPL
ncbi:MULTISPECIES: methyltransferase domain-containing protein [unclassified Ensifer]|uniref:methyltransferase domain-containing protein n=1 Tax=unclassified Ensifer TaxID=2633371 RepID=UPI0008138A85|nr:MULTISPECIES: methyltransferase domain-containing protein [unclassified Ensifer]OCO99632.1 SAM-dependent methyltransferase [Ensifer sp. LC14]OCP02582.1 SAM-dependent methyltransferase [Ensifer sp. LC11]OCP02852.1 SAM-dependent methyltransferase [Ensifer sp. LC13]OCP29872.1 SAM-dependent methyltransferase [Ensifer sp. LC499]